MRRKLLFPASLATLLFVLGLGLALLGRTRESRELDGLIAALPARVPVPARPIVQLPPEVRGAMTAARLIEVFDGEARAGRGSREMAVCGLVLTELTERAAAGRLEAADRELVGQALRADLARDPDWAGTLRQSRLSWLRWLARLREGNDFDEAEVLGPETELRRLVGGRRVGDGLILAGWRAIERFYDRIGEIPLEREDFAAALDACVETPADPGADPVTAYFARYATRDLKTTRRRIVELRRREERLLEGLR